MYINELGELRMNPSEGFAEHCKKGMLLGHVSNEGKLIRTVDVLTGEEYATAQRHVTRILVSQNHRGGYWWRTDSLAKLGSAATTPEGNAR